MVQSQAEGSRFWVQRLTWVQTVGFWLSVVSCFYLQRTTIY